jgi:hypothetical protein
MRIPRAVAGLAAVIAAVLGLNLAAAGSAAAAVSWETGSWHPYGNTNPISSSSSTWNCDVTVSIGDNVGGQICAVRSASGNSVQAAVLVRNNRSSSASVWARMELFAGPTRLGGWNCATSGVAPHSWSVCFGRSLTRSSTAFSYGSANGVLLGVSGNV